jgi:hypothetical protein
LSRPERAAGTVLDRWHEVTATRNPALLDDLLAPDCVFHSPVAHTPQRGRDLTRLYLSAAIEVFGESFRYVREIAGENQAVLEFTAACDGIEINGVDIIEWDDNGQIRQFKVMVRPLKAINLLHQRMKSMLERLSG